MGAISLKNLMTNDGVFKIVELAFLIAIVTFYYVEDNLWLVFRWSDGPDKLEVHRLGTFAIIGFLFITIILLIGIILGDKRSHMMMLLNLCGFAFFITLCALWFARYFDLGIDKAHGVKKLKSETIAFGILLGALGLIYLVDFILDIYFEVKD